MVQLYHGFLCNYLMNISQKMNKVEKETLNCKKLYAL